MGVKDTLDQNNIVIQQLAYSCGPCTLLNVLRLKGNDSYNEDQLTKLCNAKPDIGTWEADMVRVAKEIGLEVIEEKEGGKIADIERHLNEGSYVVVCYMHAYSGEGHYAVITEYDGRALYLIDPSFGMFRLRKPYFEKWWHDSTGVQQWYMAVK